VVDLIHPFLEGLDGDIDTLVPHSW
jgi:hypothetical protein